MHFVLYPADDFLYRLLSAFQVGGSGWRNQLQLLLDDEYGF